MENIIECNNSCKNKKYTKLQNISFFHIFTFIILICFFIRIIYNFFGNHFVISFRSNNRNNNLKSNNKNETKYKNDYNLVIPCKTAHIKLLNMHKKFYRKYLNYSRLILMDHQI